MAALLFLRLPPLLLLHPALLFLLHLLLPLLFSFAAVLALVANVVGIAFTQPRGTAVA